MFNEGDFQQSIKAIADNTPPHFKNTLGGCMHWIVSQAFIQHFQPRLAELENKIKELENGNEERGLQKPQRNAKATAKTTGNGEE